MRHYYRVFANGQCVARGCYAAAKAAFLQECSTHSPFEDVVLFTDHYMKPLNSN